MRLVLAFILGFAAAMLWETVVAAWGWLRAGRTEPIEKVVVGLSALVLAATPIGALIYLMLLP